MAGRLLAASVSSAAILTLLGCTQTELIHGYDGPPRPDDKVAIVQPDGAPIVRIVDESDGVRVYDPDVPLGTPGLVAGTELIVRLAPGTYRITYFDCECYNYSSIAGCVDPHCARREAVATLQTGHTYSTHTRSNCSIFGRCTKPPSIWFSDETSGEVLDGVAP
jgi:hypothetical protein